VLQVRRITAQESFAILVAAVRTQAARRTLLSNIYVVTNALASASSLMSHATDHYRMKSEIGLHGMEK
jgi:hypothetical protein